MFTTGINTILAFFLVKGFSPSHIIIKINAMVGITYNVINHSIVNQSV